MPTDFNKPRRYEHLIQAIMEHEKVHEDCPCVDKILDDYHRTLERE